MKLPELEDVMIPAKSFQGIILKFFDLQLYPDTSAYEPLKLLWERDLGVTISSADWTKICNGVFPKCTSVSIHGQKCQILDYIGG